MRRAGTETVTLVNISVTIYNQAANKRANISANGTNNRTPKQTMERRKLHRRFRRFPRMAEEEDYLLLGIAITSTLALVVTFGF